jgi:hypothetical protein
MVVFALPFSGGLPTYKLLVKDDDQGASLPNGARLQAGAELLRALERATYQDGKPMLTLRKAERARAHELLRSGTDAALFMNVAGDLSRRVAAGDLHAAQGISLEGDLSSPNFVYAHWIVDATIEMTVAALQNRPAPAHPEIRLVGDGIGRTEFDHVVPGVIIFAILLLVAQTAMLVVGEHRSGTLLRYQLSGAGTGALFAGISLAQMSIAALQVPLMTAVALLMGFHAVGSLAAAIAICMILSLSAVGLGLLVSGLDLEDDAVPIGDSRHARHSDLTPGVPGTHQPGPGLHRRAPRGEASSRGPGEGRGLLPLPLSPRLQGHPKRDRERVRQSSAARARGFQADLQPCYPGHDHRSGLRVLDLGQLRQGFQAPLRPERNRLSQGAGAQGFANESQDARSPQ